MLIPGGFDSFVGYDGRIEKKFNGKMFYIQFGSKIDSSTSKCAQEFNKCMLERQKAQTDGNQENRHNLTNVFPIISDYLESTRELSALIEWKQASPFKSTNGQNNNLHKWTAICFGDCGSGKSTFLSNVSETFAAKYVKASRGEKISFEHAKSIESVTTKVRIAQAGNCILIDTPGTNDPNRKRHDNLIQVELINSTRDLLKSKTQGINSLVQCILPSLSQRIQRSAIESMATALLTFNCLHKDANMSKHPRVCVVFNNVSKQSELEQSPEDQSDVQVEVKQEVRPEEFKSDKYITSYRSLLFEVLQDQYSAMKDEKFIKERIEQLFPASNFYFFKIRDGDKME